MLAIIDNPEGGYYVLEIFGYGFEGSRRLTGDFDTVDEAMKSCEVNWIDPPEDEDFSGDIVKISYEK